MGPALFLEKLSIPDEFFKKFQQLFHLVTTNFSPGILVVCKTTPILGNMMIFEQLWV